MNAIVETINKIDAQIEATENLRDQYRKGKLLGSCNFQAGKISAYYECRKMLSEMRQLQQPDNNTREVYTLKTALSQAIACIISGHKPDMQVIEYYQSLI